mgnify:FL=1
MKTSDLIYLDHAAATPMDERVIAAMTPYMREFFYNPSSPYAPAVEVRRAYEYAKYRLAQCIGAKADEIVITAGATESINLMVGSVSRHIVTSNIEHHAVLRAVEAHDHTLVKADEKGTVSPDAVEQAIRPDTELVTIHLANNR